MRCTITAVSINGCLSTRQADGLNSVPSSSTPAGVNQTVRCQRLNLTCTRRLVRCITRADSLRLLLLLRLGRKDNGTSVSLRAAALQLGSLLCSDWTMAIHRLAAHEVRRDVGVPTNREPTSVGSAALVTWTTSMGDGAGLLAPPIRNPTTSLVGHTQSTTECSRAHRAFRPLTPSC